MSRLDALYLERGQSPWIDNLRRDWLQDGTLVSLVDRGVRGLTSNPSIFAKALASSALYDEAIAASSATTTEQLFEELAVSDVTGACDVLTRIHEASVRELHAGVRRYSDGYVSLEVSPGLAHDATGTLLAARRLHDAVARPNLMIKIPGTAEGLTAITDALALGINVNVTLIFALERYSQVMDAHLLGLAQAAEAGRDISIIASVASFFVSRVDTAVDGLLDTNSPYRGRAANAQVAAAYDLFLERYSRRDALELLARGAQVQRPLWASTSTKNPAYDPLLYVEPNVADETVNTMPDATLELFSDHGRLLSSTITAVDVRSAAHDELHRIGEVVDLRAVTDRLEAEGVKSFEDAFAEVLATIAAKRHR
jgi:transaldolase